MNPLCQAQEIPRDVVEILEKFSTEQDRPDNIADLPVDFIVPVGDNKRVEGNTIKSSTPVKQGKQLKYWFFTYNNYPIESIETLLVLFKKICIKFVFQKEIGESGTPHLQGCIHLHKKMRWSEFKLSSDIHWEQVHNVRAAFDYCQKDETRDGDEIWRWPIRTELNIITALKPWQQQIVTLTKDIPDDRTVNWIYDPVGNMGKTVFCKYMYARHDAIICTGGGAKDIACLLAILRDAGRDLNEKTTFLFNLSRTTEGISYKGIEAVKDGLMTSQKYETSTLVFNCPHVWVLSNQEPDIHRLSGDRWKIWTIKDDNLVTINEPIIDSFAELQDYDGHLADLLVGL